MGYLCRKFREEPLARPASFAKRSPRNLPSCRPDMRVPETPPALALGRGSRFGD
jgi:hypothetical protein